ncbi:MAG: rhamnogalacturonan acetylesterase [Lachnospiraceae bacterium]|nr:rhamnogalacturonan acetylesterase [Lachnospiraceae bacterium]
MQRIIYAGDSTVTFNHIATYPQTGLSQGLSLYVKDDVFIRSFAINGRSTKSFIDQGRLQAVDQYLMPGDFLFIQFGHNDEKMSDPLRYADPHTDYRENLKKFVETARKHDAVPVLISPIARRLFDAAGKFLPGSHGEYPKACRAVAEETGTAFIEMTEASENYLEMLGDFASRPLYVYPKDNSHLTAQGAAVMAGFLADGLLKLGSPYSDLLVPRDAKVIDEDDAPALQPYMVQARGEAFSDPTLNLDAFKNEKQD